MVDIKEFLEKSMSFGLGLAAYSREKIEDIVEEMVRKGEVAQKDARQFAGDLVQKGEEQRIEIKTLVQNEVTAILDKMDLIRKSDVQSQIQAALRAAGISTEPCAPGEAKPAGPAPSDRTESAKTAKTTKPAKSAKPVKPD